MSPFRPSSGIITSAELLLREGKGKNEHGDEIHLDYSQYLERVNKMALENYGTAKHAKEQSVKGSTVLGRSSIMTH